MKPLLESRYDPVAEAMCLRYSNAPSLRSQMLDGENGSVCVDFGEKGEVVGIELVVVDDETVAPATRYANEHALGLTGANVPHAA